MDADKVYGKMGNQVSTLRALVSAFSIYHRKSDFVSILRTDPFPSYEGHSLSMLRRVAEALGATVHVAFETSGQTAPLILSESKIPYRTGKHKG